MGDGSGGASNGVRWERIALGAAGVYVLVYASWTALHWAGDRTIISDVASWPLLLGAIALCWCRARQAPGRARWAWGFIAAGCASWLLAEMTWCFLEVVLDATPFPSVADAFYLTFYPFVFAGLVAMPIQQQRARERLTLLLDSAVIMVVAIMAIWYLVIDPQVSTSYSSAWTKALALAYPAGDILLLFGVIRVLMRRPRRILLASLRILGVGLACMVAADIAFAHLDLEGSYQTGSFPDALWAVSILLVMVAAYLARDRVEALSSHPIASSRVSVLPFLAIFVGLGLLVHQAADPSQGDLLPLSIGVFVLAALVVARQVMLQRDVTQLIGELEYVASTDPLTGLASRRAFFERANRMITRAEDDGAPCAVLISDLDSFKHVNDVHGHAVGDDVLRAVARCCQEALLAGGIAGRIGGDEFAFVLPGCNREQAESFADRLAALVSKDASVIGSGAPVHTEITVGIASVSGFIALDDLLLAADSDLYRAKAQRHHAEIQHPGSPLRESSTRRTASPHS